MGSLFGSLTQTLGFGKPDPIAEKLAKPYPKFDSVFHHLESRADTASQTLRMGHLFGLSKPQIASVDWRALLMAEACDDCVLSNRCFRDAKGKLCGEPGISPRKCPNFFHMQDIADSFGNRAPIRNNVV